jgi:hypothetical protein
VPTAVTGWFGQNPYPGFNRSWGFVVSTAVIIVLAGALYLLLRRRGWLGRHTGEAGSARKAAAVDPREVWPEGDGKFDQAA